jgi:hypothetical protein
MTVFHWEVFLGLMKPQLAVLFLPLQQTCIICPRTYPLHRAFYSFLWSICTPPSHVDFLCICAESIVLVWPSSYSNLLNSINHLLLTLSDVYTQGLQEAIYTNLSPFETLIAKAIKFSYLGFGGCKLICAGILDQRQWRHCSRFRWCLECQALVSRVPHPGKPNGSISVLRVVNHRCINTYTIS